MFRTISFLILFLFSSAAALEMPKPNDGDPIVIAKKRIVLDAFADAWNPSLFKIDQGYVLSFRYTPDRFDELWLSHIGVVILDEEFQPISEPELLNTRGKNSKTPSQSEDARIFSYRGRIFLIYNDNIDVTGPKIWERRDMFMAELFHSGYHFSLSSPLKLTCEEKKLFRMCEKNWVPFEWNKTMMLGYTIDPHEVLYPNLTNGECYHCYESFPRIKWDYGTLRGGTPAMLVDGEYLSFFHSGIVIASPASFGQDLWHYFMGAYTFSAEPPFRIKKMTPTPIMSDGFYTESFLPKRVIFPGGFVDAGPHIYLAYGKDDCEIWIATIDKAALKKALVPVE